jgi:peroxiredoxin
MKRRWPALLFALLLPTAAWAGDSATDWQAILALDAGPGGDARSVESARMLASQHLATQERALRAFIKTYPQDANTFEAQLRLARLLDIRGNFENSEKARADAKQLLDALEKTATPEQRVEVDFAKVTRLMRGGQKSAKERREQILGAARKFQAAHPGDRRLPRLLVEVASLFDNQPKLKVSILNDASAAATEPDLKQRIADDMRRLDLLGQPLPLEFTALDGKPVKIEDFSGRPLLIVFFADFSPPSTEALTRLQRTIAGLPKERAAAIGVSLDPKRETLDALLKATGLRWPVAFDGKGWEGPLVRSLGINALPTVWLCDKKGRLRSLNALDTAAELIDQLARE